MGNGFSADEYIEIVHQWIINIHRELYKTNAQIDPAALIVDEVLNSTDTKADEIRREIRNVLNNLENALKYAPNRTLYLIVIFTVIAIFWLISVCLIYRIIRIYRRIQHIIKEPNDPMDHNLRFSSPSFSPLDDCTEPLISHCQHSFYTQIPPRSSSKRFQHDAVHTMYT
ncbi:hypothetical protein AB6A40_008984 [Gnathostoma spinigerum]|uniref:Uncharacterized protein n=1 Tax=Gnathostoma spinigerum TaxID=75299 RepID=A0ABD6F0Q0_9BILA